MPETFSFILLCQNPTDAGARALSVRGRSQATTDPAHTLPTDIPILEVDEERQFVTIVPALGCGTFRRVASRPFSRRPGFSRPSTFLAR